MGETAVPRADGFAFKCQVHLNSDQPVSRHGQLASQPFTSGVLFFTNQLMMIKRLDFEVSTVGTFCDWK